MYILNTYTFYIKGKEQIIMNYLKSYFANAFNFNGRSSVKDYWMTFLWIIIFNIIVGFILGIFISQGEANVNPDEVTASISIAGVISFIISFPALALSIRRLHDTNRSGWWWLLNLTVIGTIVVFVFTCLPGTPGVNNYGPQPYLTN